MCQAKKHRTIEQRTIGTKWGKFRKDKIMLRSEVNIKLC